MSARIISLLGTLCWAPPACAPAGTSAGLRVQRNCCDLAVWRQTLPAQLLVKWWAEYPGELLEARVVRPLQRYLTDELYATKKLTVSVMNVIKASQGRGERLGLVQDTAAASTSV